MLARPFLIALFAALALVGISPTLAAEGRFLALSADYRAGFTHFDEIDFDAGGPTRIASYEHPPFWHALGGETEAVDAAGNRYFVVGFTSDASAHLFALDTVTGEVTPTPLAPTNALLTTLDFDPVERRLLGFAQWDGSSRLVEVLEDGTLSPVGSLTFPRGPLQDATTLDAASDRYFALFAAPAVRLRLVTFDTHAGTIESDVLLEDLGLSGISCIAWDADDGVLRALRSPESHVNEFMTIDPRTGEISVPSVSLDEPEAYSGSCALDAAADLFYYSNREGYNVVNLQTGGREGEVTRPTASSVGQDLVLDECAVWLPALLEALRAKVDGDRVIGILSLGEWRSLDAKLRAAQASIERCNERSAAGQLRAFLHRTAALVRHGSLPDSRGDAWASRVDEILDALRTCPCTRDGRRAVLPTVDRPQPARLAEDEWGE